MRLFLDCNGVRLQVEAEGEGYPCLVPAFLGLPLARRLLSDALRHHLHLVYVDVDFGEAPMQPLDRADVVQWLEAVRLALGLGPLAVLAHSAIGMLPLAYSVAYPHAVRHAVVVAAGPMEGLVDIRNRYWEAFATSERRAARERDAAGVDELALTRLPPAEAFVRQYVKNRSRYFYNPDFDAEGLFQDVNVNIHFIARYFRRGEHPYEAPIEFERVHCPVLVAMGRYDFIMPPPVWDADRHKLALGQFCVLEASGHWPPLEEPERFATTLLHFLVGD